MCTNCCSHEDMCWQCQGGDRLAGWVYFGKPLYEKPIMKTAEQREEFNKFFVIQRMKVQENARIYSERRKALGYLD